MAKTPSRSTLLLLCLAAAAAACCWKPAEKEPGRKSLACKLFKVGCPEAGGAAPTENPPAVNLDPVFLMTKAKVFLIGSSDAGYQGTAFLVQSKDRRYLVTNFHVISPLKDIFIETEDRTVYKDIRILATDRRHDLAVLEARGVPTPQMGLGFSQVFVTSQKIFVVGYPDMRSSEQHLNFITGVISDAAYMAPCYIGKCQEKNIQFTAPINPGHSGSPVLNERAEAIGVVSWRFDKDSDIQGGNYAVPFEYVAPLLEEIQARTRSAAELFPEGKSCAADEDCDWVYFCIDGTCQKLKDLGQACSLHEDCYLPFNCMAGLCSKSGSKGDTCQYDSQCVAPNYCIQGSCKPLAQKDEACTYDYDCVSPLYCHMGKCAAELSGLGGKCAVNTDCKFPYNCIDGACKEVDMGKIQGKACTTDQDCSPLYCIMGKCQALKQENEPCAQTMDCVSGLRCKNGVCIPLAGAGEPCGDDYDCKLPLYCIQGACKDQGGAVAQGGEGAPCTSDAECAPPTYCILKKCRPLGDIGAPCATYLDCKAPYNCTGNKCVQ